MSLPLLEFDDLVCLEIVLLELCGFPLAVQDHEPVLDYIFSMLRFVQVKLLLNQNLVSFGHLDLLILEREGDSHLGLTLLEEGSLLRPVEVVVDVVAKSPFHRVQSSDRQVVLLPVN